MDHTNFVTVLPTLNALLNGTVTVFLILGRLALRSENELRHKRFMLASFMVSILFLISYMVYHLNVGSVPYQGEGWMRLVYFSILIPHSLLAAVQLPLILLAVRYGLKNQRARHRKIVFWAYPIWLFVSVSGVLVYFMLYHLN